MIPFFKYHRVYENISGKISEEISKVISSGMFINGPNVKLLEDNMNSFIGSKYCSGVSSGTDALSAAVMSLENKGGIFVCPSFTFIATAMSVARQGFDIRFVDVEFESFKPTVEMVIDKCCSNTVGVIWPHLFGEPTDMFS